VVIVTLTTVELGRRPDEPLQVATPLLPAVPLQPACPGHSFVFIAVNPYPGAEKYTMKVILLFSGVSIVEGLTEHDSIVTGGGWVLVGGGGLVEVGGFGVFDGGIGV
jgi:hypothetical protein